MEQQPNQVQTEENQIINILTLLETTYTSKDTKKIKDAEAELNALSKTQKKFF
jgi:hypothetical protein